MASGSIICPRRSRPGNRSRFTFSAVIKNPGFRNSNEQAEFAYNGTFFDRDYFPQLGYDQGANSTTPSAAAKKNSAARRSCRTAAIPMA